jgi:hypothetical protein
MLHCATVAERPDLLVNLVKQKLESPRRVRTLSRPTAVNFMLKDLPDLPRLEHNWVTSAGDSILEIPSVQIPLRDYLVSPSDCDVRIKVRPGLLSRE